jgi:hypothetical protein
MKRLFSILAMTVFMAIGTVNANAMQQHNGNN